MAAGPPSPPIGRRQRRAPCTSASPRPHHERLLVHCSTCKVQLRIAQQHGVVIDYCTTCWGVWLDQDELDTILERSSAVVEAPALTWRPLRHQRTIGRGT
ncbi:MAG: zf-TFIIB domain-containing protein [Chloroflexi bacterium]|nr:zf-TFIIB domain-containing protein [Chloroflexota bacterium]